MKLTKAIRKLFRAVIRTTKNLGHMCREVALLAHAQRTISVDGTPHRRDRRVMAVRVPCNDSECNICAPGIMDKPLPDAPMTDPDQIELARVVAEFQKTVEEAGGMPPPPTYPTMDPGKQADPPTSP